MTMAGATAFSITDIGGKRRGDTFHMGTRHGKTSRSVMSEMGQIATARAFEHYATRTSRALDRRRPGGAIHDHLGVSTAKRLRSQAKVADLERELKLTSGLIDELQSSLTSDLGVRACYILGFLVLRFLLKLVRSAPPMIGCDPEGARLSNIAAVSKSASRDHRRAHTRISAEANAARRMPVVYHRPRY